LGRFVAYDITTTSTALHNVNAKIICALEFYVLNCLQFENNYNVVYFYS